MFSLAGFPIKAIKRFIRCFLREYQQVRTQYVLTKRTPYPVSIKPRDLKTENRRSWKKRWLSEREGPEIFDKQDSLELNKARLSHLDSLNLPLKGKTVLDVGCGVGHLAQFLVSKGCKVICVDGRSENIAKLRKSYPNLEAYVVDVETKPLRKIGKFDIVFAYGLLYHLENPVASLRNMESVCKELLLLETVICDFDLPILRLVDESLTATQALKGVGCRPSPSYVVQALNRIGFPFIYAPKKPPAHKAFLFDWKNDLKWMRERQNLRSIFIASKSKLDNPHIVDLLNS